MAGTKPGLSGRRTSQTMRQSSNHSRTSPVLRLANRSLSTCSRASPLNTCARCSRCCVSSHPFASIFDMRTPPSCELKKAGASRRLPVAGFHVDNHRDDSCPCHERERSRPFPQAFAELSQQPSLKGSDADTGRPILSHSRMATKQQVRTE